MNRDYYRVMYNRNSNRPTRDILDNETEFNANQFKLYDDFTTDLRINFNSIRNFHEVMRNERRRADLNDSGVDLENGNPLDDVTANDRDLLENEVMVDPWSSMDSSNSPLTDSGPSASEDCTPSTSSETRNPRSVSSPESPDTRRKRESKDTQNTYQAKQKQIADKARARDFTLDLETLPDAIPRRSNFLDDEFQLHSNTNLECRIPKPHFLDHSPSPDELDERSDITNPNFLEDDDVDDNQVHKKGALPKRQTKPQSSTQEDRPHRTSYRSALHYGLENAARSSERHKRASQLYTGTWPGERDVWTGHDTSSVRSFSSNGSSDCPRPSSNLENKMECVCSLISLLSLSPENNADLSGPLLDMSRSVESCIAMRQAGCIPLLVQLIHSKVARETRDRAAKALRNIIHTQTDDKAGRREARVWRLLEQVREYCYSLEDIVENRKEGKEALDDDTTKHPSQSVAALMKLSFDEEHRHVVCQLGGLQALAALVSGDQAAHGSRTDDGTCLTMRKYAGMTLTNLTFGDGNNKSLLCSFKDFMMALVEQLESPNDDMRQVTAAVLRNLSWRADANSKQVLREVGAVKGLTKAAMTCQKEATLKSVLSALWNLTAHCSMNKVALCSVDGALGFLVDMLSYNSPTKTLAIVENAGGIMRNVSSHIAVREDYRQILRERNCLSVLLQHLKSPSLTVVSNSCGTLWNLSARCPQDQQFLWDRGAVPMLRSLIHSKHKMIAMGSSAALKNLLNSKPGKTHIISLDTTARNMNLPALPTLGARKQKALEQELDQNLAETCDNIEPATSPSTSNREEKSLFVATERQIAMNLERHRMTSSSPLMGTLGSQISLSHSANLAGYLSCSNTSPKGALTSRSATGGSSDDVDRSGSKDSVTSTHSDSVFEKVLRTGKVPVPTPRNKDLMKTDGAEGPKSSGTSSKNAALLGYASQPPVPPPRSSTDSRTNYTESGYDVDQDSCDQPIDFSRKYSETKIVESEPVGKAKIPNKKYPKKGSGTFGDYQETDLDQPTDYSLRYAELQSETGSDTSEPPGPSIDEDTIKHFATEGTPYETPIIFSTATSMSDLRVIGKDGKPKTSNAKENPEVMTHSDEKDTCSIEDPPRHDNDVAVSTPQTCEPVPDKREMFDTKFSSGTISPERPVNYCDEGTPGYFSRVSSLSSIGEPTEEDCLAKRNAQATINVDPGLRDRSTGSSGKDKEASKAVTFASEPVEMQDASGTTSARTSSPQRFIEETPLMFSRSSSLGSVPECEHQDDQGSVISEVSRLTSGCISPSEIPDSPGQSVPLSPRSRHRVRDPPTEPPTPPPPDCGAGSVFEERVSRFVVENTPAHFSRNTSLSSLTINDEPKSSPLADTTNPDADTSAENIEHGVDDDGDPDLLPDLGGFNKRTKGNQTPGDTCKVYFTEDTPAVLSKAGSNSNLSVLSVESSAAGLRPADTSDSSNLSDAGDLLEECIRKGIAQVVKNKGPSSDASPVRAHRVRDDVYVSHPLQRSLPSYLRSSTETVLASHEPTLAGSVRDGASPSGPPPLPPKTSPRAPPRPPAARSALRFDDLPGDEGGGRPPVATALAGNDSLSSLSLDSFGSTDREIFEETVQAGLSSVDRDARYVDDSLGAKARSGVDGQPRHHKSLDRSDKITRLELRLRDPDSDRRSRSDGAKGAGRRPAAPPAGIDRGRDRSDSPSSLSNDSFGSTDKEVFERCVRMGMAEPAERRGRSDDRLEARESRRRRKDETRGALDRMVGEEYSRDRAVLEEAIARGAGERRRPRGPDEEPKPKNVPAPPALLAAAGARADLARETGSDPTDFDVRSHSIIFFGPSEPPAPLESEFDRSNECLAPESADAAVESEKGELDRSNESYADALESSWSDDCHRPGDAGTPTRRSGRPDDVSKHDTWNENTCPDDVTFPTVSGSVHLVSSVGSDPGDPASALPDLLEKSDARRIFLRPDLTDKLGEDRPLLDDVPEPSYASLVEDGEQKFDSLMAAAIEQEAARLAAQLKLSLENGATSSTSASIDLDRVNPPSNLGSLLSLSASGQWEDASAHAPKRSHKTRKKSLPVASMVKRALSNSHHLGSSEHLDAPHVTILDNVKPPSEMENVDMEGSMISVSSIVSEAADPRDRPPILFDFGQPVRDFPLSAMTGAFHDLDGVNPPSLFDEMAESTLELEQTTAQLVLEDCESTLNVVTDIPSGSDDCTPLPSDIGSVESTPKRPRDPAHLTPKERRKISNDRYQTYTIKDSVSQNEFTPETEEPEEYLTWTKSESDRSEDYATADRESPSRRRTSARQRRLEDRARYQTQTVDVRAAFAPEAPAVVRPKGVDPEIESLKRRLAAKKTVKQRRTEDAERYRTRTLSEDVPPSPTFVAEDANFENVETTTGYDSLSSNEPNHQQILDERRGDDVFRDVDSGHNEDDFDVNSAHLETYTESFGNYLPVVGSPASVDLCAVNNLKNIEMTASYRRAFRSDTNQNLSTGDFASLEGDANSEGRARSEPDTELNSNPPKPKIVKPEFRRDRSLDSNDSGDGERESPKPVRGRKKAAYVSPYRRSAPAPKKAATPQLKSVPKASTTPKSNSISKPIKTPPKVPSATSSPKKSVPSKTSLIKTAQKASATPSAGKSAPLVRQGTFTKEESSIPPKNLPIPEAKPGPGAGSATSPNKPSANTSPSRLPRFGRPRAQTSRATPQPKQTKTSARRNETALKNSPSSQSLQSNDSGKTVVLARGSRQGSASSVNSMASPRRKDVDSKVANLWRRAERTRKLPARSDRKVWIESDETEAPKLIRSSTFEGRPERAVSAATKQKTAIGIRVSQIPSPRPGLTPAAKAVGALGRPALAKGPRKPSGRVTS
ncbi:adenomatous polyposis coli protein-like isoform X1 [Pieris brassicae]|uniref:adenomatous polyposis coli protein-like isoform X1 n=2 Tax=Pieris brassicae TaxID=7116 RepID=UPI001E6615A1|nr:adenomatous polyposis coli protein-like isoform X1 [Pieris brassicae]